MFFDGRCAALSQAVPLYPFVGMLRHYFDLTPGESEDAACAKLEHRLHKNPDEVDAAFPLLCRVLSVPAELPADLPLEALKQETFAAITKLVHMESRRAPVVMVLEDLHWIDESSHELLEMAVARLMRARVMILLSHRPDYRQSWRTSAAVTALQLRPLLDDDVAHIARTLAGGELPAELAARILSKAEGSPFFAEELTRSLLEDGYITGDGNAVRTTRPLDEIFIPGSVREVIAARLDRLGSAAKRVAQLAAVLGRQFRRGDLAQLLAPEAVDVDHELGELSRRGVIHRKSLFSDDEYRFGESLTQEVAYESLLLKQRRQLHERVAALLEAGGGDPSLAGPALIAHHYALSENRAKAVETLLRAAAEAERLPSFRTAIDLCRQAWELGEAGLRERGADPRFKEWILAATLGYTRLTVLYASSSDPEAERAAVRGQELARELGNVEAGAILQTMHGMLLTADPARFADGMVLAEEAVEVARQSGSELHVINASRAVAWHCLLDGRFAAAQEKSDWIVAELERRDMRGEDIYLGARWMRDAVRFYSDDLEGARRGSEETYELTVQRVNHTVQSGAASVLSMVEFAQARYAEAKRWAERSLETSEAIGNLGGVHRGQALLLATRVALGEGGGLGTLADAIEQSIAKGGNALLYVHSVAEALLAVGEVKRAERMARTAVELAGGRYRVLLCGIALADVLSRLGPAYWAEADRAFERALALADSVASRSSRAHALLGRGRLATARGQNDAALRAWREARALFEAVGMTRYERLAATLLGDSGSVVSPTPSAAPALSAPAAAS
jgi:tetratricopeptide (TPR) repeat protein